MDPITTVAIWAILALVTANLFRRPKAAKATAKALPAPAPTALDTEHRLVKTYIEMYGDGVMRGWRAKCSCGAISYATNATLETSSKRATYGTETNVIEAYEKHAENFKRANGNPYKDQIEALKKELDAQRAACFCKDVSHVELLPLKD